MNCEEVIDLAYKAFELKRIKQKRLYLVIAAMTVLQTIERENQK